MMMMVVAALRLLKRTESLLRPGEVAILQVLADLVEGLRQWTAGICRRTLSAALELAQCRVRLLRV